MQSIKAAIGGKMSDNNNVRFSPVDRSENLGGPLIVIRGGKMLTFGQGSSSEEPLESGTTIQGVFEGSVPNKFNEERRDYKVRGADQTLYILADSATLNRQLAKVQTGELIEIVYNGKKTVKRKTGGMAEMHDYRVSRAIVDSE